MNKILFLFLLICASSNSFCQIGNQTTGNVVSSSNFGFIQGNHLPNSFLKTGNKIIRYKDIDGTPYVDNKQKLIHEIPSGKIYTSEFKLMNTLFIRYNGLTDNMELSKIDDGIDYYVLKKKPNAWYVVLGTNKYKSYNYNAIDGLKIGFFVIVSIHDNKYCTLLKKEKVNFKDAVVEQNAFIPSSSARFTKAKNRFYIKIGDAINEVPKKEKDFVKLFIKNKDLLEIYLAKNKYKLNNQKDVLKIIDYYNSIVIID